MINTTAQKTQTKPLAAISAAKEVSTVRSLSASTRRIEEAKPTSETSNTGAVKSLTDIARKYDVRSISPRDMATMSQELYQSGAISLQEHVLLSFQPELNPESSKTLAGAYALKTSLHSGNHSYAFTKAWAKPISQRTTRGY